VPLIPPETDLRARFRAAFTPGRFPRLGVAVSGGSDSMALLHLLAEARQNPDGPGSEALQVVTVDHGLRPEAATEAEMVAAAAAALGLPHTTLRWQGAAGPGWDGQGNLSDAARRARYGLMAAWAREAGLQAVALGHTADDQAETLLMRLARGAGIDGLSAMAPERASGGMLWLRPMLGLTRAALRADLQARGVVWAEDPSNQDARYTRVRFRRALADLAPLGLTAEGLAAVAAQLQSTRAALDVQMLALAERAVRRDHGDLLIDPEPLAAAPAEIRRRLVEACLRWITRADYGPRAPALAGFIAALMAGEAATLHGCRLVNANGGLRLCREAGKVPGPVPQGQVWDRRWQISGPMVPGAEIGALGAEGLAQLPDWRTLGRPRAALLADPALWAGAELLAAPTAGFGAKWRIEPVSEQQEFPQALLSH
jgi:tRNA(Ile)-lysidine synthase